MIGCGLCIWVRKLWYFSDWDDLLERFDLVSCY